VEFRRFERTIFQFLEELSDSNNRLWFQEHKPRYEREVLEPSLAFIRAFAPRLKKISQFFKGRLRHERPAVPLPK